jgi:hypothetical protein
MNTEIIKILQNYGIDKTLNPDSFDKLVYDLDSESKNKAQQLVSAELQHTFDWDD